MAAPANDNFTQAQSITYASFPINADNSQATTEVGEPTSHYNSMWYNFSSPNSGTLNLTVGSAFEIAVYTNDILQELNPVTPLAGSGNNITVPILNNLAYNIVVYSATSSQTGAFTMAATFVPIAYPANDNFANAQVLTGNLFNVSTDNSLATIEFYEDTTNYFSVWYQYIPAITGQFTLAQTSGIPLNFKFYVGTDIQNAVQVSASQSSISCPLLAGIKYYIAVNSQSSTSYGAFSFSGALANQLDLQFIGPQTSPSELSYNLTGLNSIVVDPSNARIYVMRDNPFSIFYSDNQGTSFTLDRTFTFAAPPYIVKDAENFPAMFLDENGNIVVAFFTNDGASNYNANFSVRNKSSGVWTDYTSTNIGAIATNYSICSSFCQGEDKTIHAVITIPNQQLSEVALNIVYCNYKTGTISTPKTITRYGSLYSTGFYSIQLVNWTSGIYIFWRSYLISGSNANGNLNYCVITPSNPLVMDAIDTTAWRTGHQFYVGDLVTEGGQTYICLIQHFPTFPANFALDLANGDWALLGSTVVATTVPSLVNNDVYNIKSDGTNLYFITGNSGTLNSIVYKNFLDITPYDHPFLIAGHSLNHFEIAMNGDIVLYLGQINSLYAVLMRINGVWQAGNLGINSNYQNAYFSNGHTYNFAQLV